MKDNYKLMATLASRTRVHPEKRIEKLMDLHQALSNKHITRKFATWSLKLDNNLLDVPARVLPPANIAFRSATIKSTYGDWAKDMQNKRCFINQELHDWVLIASNEERSDYRVQVPCRLSSRYAFIYNDIYPLMSLIEMIKSSFCRNS